MAGDAVLMDGRLTKTAEQRLLTSRVKAWYDALFVRHSRRSFTTRKPDDETLQRLEQVAREVRPFLGVRVELVRESPDEVFTGLLGSYGRVKGAPLYAAFLGDLTHPRVQEATGYTGEAVILEAVALGLDTCWVGGFFRPRAVERHVRLAPGERVLAVTPLGYARAGKSAEERLLSGLVQSHRRKSLADLARGYGPSSPPWVHKALAAARLAPSATNRQPWRFTVEENALTISLDAAQDDHLISKRLDCGIAMLHLELGALAAGVAGQWEFQPLPEVARFVGLTKEEGE
jgi:nitroreductase